MEQRVVIRDSGIQAIIVLMWFTAMIIIPLSTEKIVDAIKMCN